MFEHRARGSLSSFALRLIKMLSAAAASASVRAPVKFSDLETLNDTKSQNRTWRGALVVVAAVVLAFVRCIPACRTLSLGGQFMFGKHLACETKGAQAELGPAKTTSSRAAY